MRKSIIRRAGLTLVECIAALLIIAIILPVAMRGISLCVRLASDVRHRTEATDLARAKMNELIVSNEWQSADLRGDFLADHNIPDYTWTASTETWSDPSMLQLDVEVAWPVRTGTSRVHLTTLVPAE